MESKHNIPRGKSGAMHQSKPEPVLNDKVQAQLGRRLRVMFDGDAEPVPDRFLELLTQIDTQLRVKS